MKSKLTRILFLSAIICSLAACEAFNNNQSQGSQSQSTDTSLSSSNEETTSSKQDLSLDNSSSETPSSSIGSSSSEASSSLTDSSSMASSSSKQSSSSSQQSSSSIEPVTNSIEPFYAGRTYGDYANNSAYEISVTPATGNAKLLVVPVWFTNSSTYIDTNSRELVRSDIEKAYFGTNEETGWRSVKTYYEEESHGQLTITGTVTEWYEDTVNSSTRYGSYTTGVTKTATLVRNVTDWYFNNHPEDNRTNYDCDGDGFLDGVMVVYAAPDYSVTQSTRDLSNLWAYCYWQEEATRDVVNPNVNAYFWASFDFMYGSNTIVNRTGMSKSRGYANGDTSRCTIDAHTFIHEMGHMFGLEDYYDYSGQYDPAGAFSMQDYAIGGHDPFSSFALGWGKAYIPTESMTINLNSFSQTGEMIILSPSWNEYNSPFDEYLIIEYFTPDCLNAFDVVDNTQGVTGSKTAGIRLWHVDARLLGYKGEDRIGNPEFVVLNTADPSSSQYPVITMMSNTYSGGDEDSQGYISPLGEDYADYDILHMIRNDSSVPHKTKTKLKSSYLFTTSQGFSMNGFASQFVNSGKLNSNKTLGFSFVVNSLTDQSASITITKA